MATRQDISKFLFYTGVAWLTFNVVKGLIKQETPKEVIKDTFVKPVEAVIDVSAKVVEEVKELIAPVEVPKETLKADIKDEAKAEKEYKKQGLDNLAADEHSHKKFLEGKLTKTDYHKKHKRFLFFL
jgi:hypothetical protein